MKPQPEPSSTWRQVRDQILGLSDDDRRRLAGLFGRIGAPLPLPSPALFATIEAVLALDRSERDLTAKWVRTYVNQWGQVPQAASRRHPAYQHYGHVDWDTTDNGDYAGWTNDRRGGLQIPAVSCEDRRSTRNGARKDEDSHVTIRDSGSTLYRVAGTARHWCAAAEG